ncbi:uncharacterized protein LOC131846848 [Achroia grisella]|uniref:uncharacterized protein LOC131846848 n=1 Tax=Achroia grisella TaxID=688607 RepID=UPI0027D2CEA1|nr:uncharacterized protein LOC131846848 [Achroia grisella]
MSKSRVSSLEPTPIARLELQAALLGVRLADTITRDCKQKINARYFWCDSRVALSWIRSDARNFKAFVANRVGEISESTLPREWRWVPSELNVADDATRVTAKSSIELNRWLNGPSFLMATEEQWPVEPAADPVAGQDLKCHQTVLADSRPYFNIIPNSKNFSNWLRLLRATARAHQFLRLLIESKSNNVFSNNRCRFTNRGTLRPLLFKDMKSAELHLLRQSQAESFSLEIAALHRDEPLPKSSRIGNLSIKLSSDGLLRLDGRISATPDLCDEVKCPPILDGRNEIVHLLVQYYHIWACHGYNETVVNELRQRYWILHLRPTVRSIAARCQACRIKKASISIPPEGDLPVCRLEHHQRPFLNTGLDYFGPMEVTIGRRREKRYVALFTCLSVRAVHLEIVGNLSADAAIMALRRFMSRRGVPSKIFSDNGTAFVGASREIRTMWRAMNHAEVADYATSRGIEWNFIPPLSPFMGGCWERLVQSVKRALAAVVKSKSFKEETLITFLAEIEHVINSRPLTHISVEAGEGPDSCDLDAKLKVALVELKKTQDLNKVLLQEQDDSEIEMKSLFNKYVALKGELVNINVFCEDLRVDRDRLQEIVNEYDHCRDTYESNLQRITHLERHLEEAQAHSESMLEHKRVSSYNNTLDLYTELLNVTCDQKSTQPLVTIDLTNTPSSNSYDSCIADWGLVDWDLMMPHLEVIYVSDNSRSLITSRKVNVSNSGGFRTESLW